MLAAGLLRLFGPSAAVGYSRIADGAVHPDAEFLGATGGAANDRAVATDDAATLSRLAQGAHLLEGDGEAPSGVSSVAIVAFRGADTVDAVRAAADGAVGVILNAVPAPQARYVENEIRPALTAAGVRLLGVLPEERRLRAATVLELARYLDGEVMTAPEALGELVESYMVGAMSHVSGIPYFLRRENKVVICGGERIDVHLAALGTPCRAIVVTGGYDPDPVVIERAEADGVPIVKVFGNSVATLDRVSDFLRQVRFHHPEKIARAADLVRTHVDVDALARVVGVQGVARGA